MQRSSHRAAPELLGSGVSLLLFWLRSFLDVVGAIVVGRVPGCAVAIEVIGIEVLGGRERRELGVDRGRVGPRGFSIDDPAFLNLDLVRLAADGAAAQF